MLCFHMSRLAHPVGAKLSGNGEPKVAQQIEDALETHRPAHCLSRFHSVYTVDIPDFSMLGLEEGYIFRVEISADAQRYDVYWIGQMQLALLKPKYATSDPLFAAKWPDWTDDFVVACCSRYWAGANSPTPRHEFICSEATVIKQLSDRMIPAGETRGGWVIPVGA